MISISLSFSLIFSIRHLSVENWQAPGTQIPYNHTNSHNPVSIHAIAPSKHKRKMNNDAEQDSCSRDGYFYVEGHEKSGYNDESNDCDNVSIGIGW